MIYANKTNKELTALLTEFRDRASVLFALEAPTIEQVDEAETLVASIKDIEAEQRLREDAAKEAADRFQAARAAFAVDPEGEDEENFASEDDADAEDGAEDGAEDEAEAEDDGEAEPEAEVDPEVEAEAEAGAEVAVDSAVAAASQRKQQRVPAGSAARKVARRVARPDVASTPQVTVTVAADVPGFAAGAQLDAWSRSRRPFWVALVASPRSMPRPLSRSATQMADSPRSHPSMWRPSISRPRAWRSLPAIPIRITAQSRLRSRATKSEVLYSRLPVGALRPRPSTRGSLTTLWTA